MEQSSRDNTQTWTSNLKSLSLIVREALRMVKKNPFKTDLRITGGQERDGGQQRTHHTDDAPYSGSGSGLSTRGAKFWSRSADEFEQPQTSNPTDKTNVEETDEIYSDPPVGLPVPEFFGGRGGAGIKNKYLGHRKR